MELQKLVFALKTTCSGGQLADDQALLPDLQRCAHHLVNSGQAATVDEAVRQIGEHVAEMARPASTPASLKLAAKNLGALLPIVHQSVQGLQEAEQGLSESMAGLPVRGWSVERGDLWTLVMDQQVKFGPFVQSGHPFSYSEPGYVENLLRGMREVVKDVQQPIDANGLKAMHRAALRHRIDTPGTAGEFRDGMAVEFAPACGDWANDAHVQKLREAHGDNTTFYALEEIEGRGTVVHAKALPRAELESHVDAVLREHHQAMSTCASPEEKIERIAHTCHELALTHPFIDGNGRVLGGLLVNRLLLEAGLPPYRPPSVGLVDLPVADLAEHIGLACLTGSAIPELQKPRSHYTDFLSNTAPTFPVSPTATQAARFPAPSPC